MLAVLASASCTSDDPRPARWTFIATEILQPNCATGGCHSSLSATAGIVLDTPEHAYAALVTDPPDELGAFVVPGSPETSALLYLLRGDEIVRMPPDTPLPEVDILLIEEWILAGAEDQ